MSAIIEAAVPLAVAMTAAERTLLRAAAEDRSAGLEFGCGGSTALLIEAGMARLTSVDSDAAWLARVAEAPGCATARAAGRLNLLHADIGPTGDWGWPVDASVLQQWPAYWRDPWEQAGSPDFVLVDGRFRVACALAAVPRLAPGGHLLIHDFWSRVAYRGPVLRHFSLIGSAGSLALLRPRAPFDAAMLAVDLVAHAFDPR
mgnify:FL=1